MPSPPRRFVLLACLLAVGMGYYYFALFLPYAHAGRAAHDLNRGYVYGCDFYPVWLTSHELLSHRENPYTEEMTTRIQIGLFQRKIDPLRPGDPLINLEVFPHPIYADFLIAPLGILPFPLVQRIGALLFPGLVVLALSLWLMALDLHLAFGTRFIVCLLALATYPVLEGIYALQLSLIVFALLAGSVAALVRQRLTLGGALLALATVKPQMIFLPALFLTLWAFSNLRRRKTFLLSFAGTIALLLLIGEIVLPGWFLQWLRSLWQYHQYNQPPLSQFAFGEVAGGMLSLSLLAVAVACMVRGRRSHPNSPRFIMTLAFLLAIAVPAIPSTIAVYDQLFLVPAILWLLVRARYIVTAGFPLRGLGFAAVLALGWQWLAALVLSLWSLGYPVAHSARWVLLPIRMATSVPFAVIALCLFLAWKLELFKENSALDTPLLSRPNL